MRRIATKSRKKVPAIISPPLPLLADALIFITLKISKPHTQVVCRDKSCHLPAFGGSHGYTRSHNAAPGASEMDTSPRSTFTGVIAPLAGSME